MPSSRPGSPETAAPAPLLDQLLKPQRRPLILGVVNVTPDSFFPGSRRPDAQAAVDEALRMADEGADWIDIGGQSTRPGSDAVSLEEETRRVLPVIERLAGRLRLPLSIDTDKADVARRARQAGASILNDVSALRADPEMAAEAARFEAVILMHRGGDSPKTMQQAPHYDDVVGEVRQFLRDRLREFARHGGDPRRALVDPGIGFGKELEHNLSLLKHLEDLSAVAPVVLGASRKSFIGRLSSDAGPEERLEGSLAAACWAAGAGVKAVRVHDVKATRRALDVAAAILGAR